jgi:hypothetical protein
MLIKLQKLWFEALDEVGWVGRNLKRGDYGLSLHFLGGKP